MERNEVIEQHERLPLGDFIAAQRRAAEMSLRQLAERAGITNPYVSQIERGLRKPSAEVLNQIATALSVSAESPCVRAGIIDPDEPRPTSICSHFTFSDCHTTNVVILELISTVLSGTRRTLNFSTASEVRYSLVLVRVHT